MLFKKTNNINAQFSCGDIDAGFAEKIKNSSMIDNFISYLKTNNFEIDDYKTTKDSVIVRIYSELSSSSFRKLINTKLVNNGISKYYKVDISYLGDNIYELELSDGSGITYGFAENNNEKAKYIKELAEWARNRGDGALNIIKFKEALADEGYNYTSSDYDTYVSILKSRDGAFSEEETAEFSKGISERIEKKYGKLIDAIYKHYKLTPGDLIPKRYHEEIDKILNKYVDDDFDIRFIKNGILGLCYSKFSSEEEGAFSKETQYVCYLGKNGRGHTDAYLVKYDNGVYSTSEPRNAMKKTKSEWEKYFKEKKYVPVVSLKEYAFSSDEGFSSTREMQDKVLTEEYCNELGIGFASSPKQWSDVVKMTEKFRNVWSKLLNDKTLDKLFNDAYNSEYDFKGDHGTGDIIPVLKRIKELLINYGFNPTNEEVKACLTEMLGGGGSSPFKRSSWSVKDAEFSCEDADAEFAEKEEKDSYILNLGHLPKYKETLYLARIRHRPNGPHLLTTKSKLFALKKSKSEWEKLVKELKIANCKIEEYKKDTQITPKDE